MTLTLSSAQASQVTAAVKGALATSLGVSEDAVSVTAEASRRLRAAGPPRPPFPPRRLSATWSISYEVSLGAEEVLAGMTALEEMASDSASFGSALATKLVEAGVSSSAASSLAVSGVSGVSLATLTTTTATTTTTTKTTTTEPGILNAPELGGAELTRSFTTMVLLFSGPTVVLGLDSRAAVCGRIFDDDMMERLGWPISCTFTASRTALHVILGSAAEVQLSDAIATKAGAFAAYDETGLAQTPATPAMQAQLGSAEELVPVVASVSASPPSTQACSDVTFSSADSTGAAGRLLRTTWSFGPGVPAEMRAALQGLVDKANANNASTLQIGAAHFSAAVDAVRTALGPASYATTPVHLELRAEVANWLGSVSAAAAAVEVIKEEEPLPQVSPLGATALLVNASDTVSFSIGTKAVSTSQCAAANAAAGDVASTVVVVWSWRYEEDWQDPWVPLVGSEFVDASPQPNVVRFRPFTFQPGSVVLMRATAAFPHTTTAELPQAVFTLSVRPAPPPVAVVAGPRSVAGACAFVLDASGSSDPSLPPTEVPDLAFAWSCEPATKSDPACDGLSNFAIQDAVARTDGLGSAGQTLRVAGGQLAAGRYRFTVLVTRRSTEKTHLAHSSAAYELLVEDGAPPPITIEATWQSMELVSVQARRESAVANIQGSDSCPIPDSHTWQWVLVDEQSSSVMELSSVTERTEGGSSVRVSSSDFRGNLLSPGEAYSFALFRTTPGQAAGVSVATSAALLADGAPSSGSVAMEPQTGEAVRTKFSFTTMGWFDEDVSTLTYAFYRFPLSSSGAQLTADGQLPARFTPPEIEWDNATDPRHWVALGGLQMRARAASPVASDIMLPQGAYFVAVRAHDAVGGRSTAFLLGPLVSEPVGGLDEADVAEALDATLASNNAEQILNAVDSVSSTTSAGADAGAPKASAAVTGQALSALETAVTIVEPNTEGVQKVGQVVNSVVGSSEASPEVISRASSILDNCLEAAMAGDEGGVSVEAGNAMLGSVATLGSAGQAASQTSSADAEAAAEKVAELTSKLGEATIAKLPVGSTETLSAVGADGKGAEIDLARLDGAAAATDGVAVEGLAVPATAMGGARRLAECSDISVQQTQWLKSNQYSWAQASLGQNAYVAADADVKDVEVRQCGQAMAFTGLADPILITMPMVSSGPPPAGFERVFRCARFDRVARAWTTDGLSVKVHDSSSGTITCAAAVAGGSYTAYQEDVPLPTVTATTTETAATTPQETSQQEVTPLGSAPVGSFSQGGGEASAASAGIIMAGLGVSFVLLCGCFVALVKRKGSGARPKEDIPASPANSPPSSPTSAGRQAIAMSPPSAVRQSPPSAVQQTPPSAVQQTPPSAVRPTPPSKWSAAGKGTPRSKWSAAGKGTPRPDIVRRLEIQPMDEDNERPTFHGAGGVDLRAVDEPRDEEIDDEIPDEIAGEFEGLARENTGISGQAAPFTPRMETGDRSWLSSRERLAPGQRSLDDLGIEDGRPRSRSVSPGIRVVPDTDDEVPDEIAGELEGLEREDTGVSGQAAPFTPRMEMGNRSWLSSRQRQAPGQRSRPESPDAPSEPGVQQERLTPRSRSKSRSKSPRQSIPEDDSVFVTVEETIEI